MVTSHKKIIRKHERSPFIAQDKAIVRDIVSPVNSDVKNQSLAEVVILPDASILEHYHKETEELYYILEGVGKMYIENDTWDVGVGDTVIILPGQRHQFTNIGKTDLRFLAMCSPAYRDEDRITVE